jgi:bifunctional non-homologous end joining protein LigD
VSDLLARIPEPVRDRLRPGPQPDWLSPMLATLTYRRFSDQEWIFERKLDGVRCLAFRSGGEVRLLSRNRKALNGTYPEVVDVLGAQEAGDFVVDGEIVAFAGGRTSFARLQGRMQLTRPEAARRSGIAVSYYLFDLLYAEGHLLTGLPLRLRKALLRRALSFRSPLCFTGHRNAAGEAVYEEACRRGWEGLVAKRADSTYQGRRSTDWLKLKCDNRQEFVIGGFTEPAGSRVGLGALLVGYHENGRLRYAGKVGTGYDVATLRRLADQLTAMEQEESPFAGDRVPGRGAHWVRPELVAEVAFTEWTRDGKLRHPRFLGLRPDKPAREVVRERPVDRN